MGVDDGDGYDGDVDTEDVEGVGGEVESVMVVEMEVAEMDLMLEGMDETGLGGERGVMGEEEV